MTAGNPLSPTDEEHKIDRMQLVEFDAAGRSLRGYDPRELKKHKLEAAGIHGNPLLKVIRRKCLDCCCEQINEVLNCTAVQCPLWPYRMGKNPFSNKKGQISNLHPRQPQ